MLISMMVAMATNKVIGKDNKLPWHIPEDLKHFKRVTSHKPVIMGRKTFESIGKPLPQRCNIVVTRDPNWTTDDVIVVNSPEEALERALNIGKKMGVRETVVIGGSEIYQQLLPKAHRLYVTQIHAEVEGDAIFPELCSKEWIAVFKEDHNPRGKNKLAYSFVTYTRLPKKA